MIAPPTMLIIGVIGGLGAAATYGAYRYAEKLSSKLTLADLLPAPPWIGLPLPRFIYTRPELIEQLRRV